jgi:hypothetical protein
MEGLMGEEPLDALLSSDVARDLGRANDLPRRIKDWRDRYRDIDRAPVFMTTDGFVMFDLLAGTDSAQNTDHFVSAIWRHDRADIPAHYLVGRVPVQILSTAIPAQDGAVQALGNDGITRRLDDRSQENEGGLGSHTRGACNWRPLHYFAALY